jgi:hypothetical protein
MYNIHLVESRESDRPVLEKPFRGSALADAIAEAKLLIKNIDLAKPPSPWSSVVIGFIIYDDSGREVHRQYLGEK